jgi:hypothetical protein
VSELVIGLTVVAIGTSLPELAVSIISALKGEHDMAIGNIIGSNLFNSLAVIGIAGIIHPAEFERELLTTHLPVMIGLTLVLFLMTYNFGAAAVSGARGRFPAGGVLLLPRLARGEVNAMHAETRLDDDGVTAARPRGAGDRGGGGAVAAGADGPDFVRACRYCLACRGRVVVTGMGKSGHVAGKIAATLASTGTPSFFVHPGEASHGDLGMITPADVVLAISNSGETPEILTILPLIKRLGVPLIAMTGRPARPSPRRPTPTWTWRSPRRPARSTSPRPPAPRPRSRWATRWRWRC